MDLGIKGRKALLCASSKGLGKACALALSREGVTVWINGRNQGPLDEAAAEIRAKTGGTVNTVKADINTDAGRKALLAACPEPDMLVNNNEGPPRASSPIGTRRNGSPRSAPICCRRC